MKRIMLAAAAIAVLYPAQAASPTVIELYQSQGCSSCPPAIANVNAVADRPGILALTFAVTYWDRLGWKDTFAKPAFTDRQYEYAGGLHHASVYTPQVIVNGRSDLVGADARELAAAIAHATPIAGPDIVIGRDVVSVSARPHIASADVWLVRYDPRPIPVHIGAGENSGVTITHRDVVRDLVRLGAWHGTAQNYSLPPLHDAAWRSAILVQQTGGGPILSAAQF